MGVSDPYLPAGTRDGDSYFSLPSGGDDSHMCEGDGCEPCKEAWLQEVMASTNHLDDPWVRVGVTRDDEEG